MYCYMEICIHDKWMNPPQNSIVISQEMMLIGKKKKKGSIRHMIQKGA